jgi:hypothetical protein
MDQTADSGPPDASSAHDDPTTNDGFDRTALGYALLFSVPVWVGVTMMMLKVTGGRPLALTLAPGLVIGAVIFVFILAATRGGYATE